MTAADVADQPGDRVAARESGAWLQVRREAERLEIRFNGDWTTFNVGPGSEELEELSAADSRRAVIDLQPLRSIDTAGAWLIARTAAQLRAAGTDVELRNVTPEVGRLLDTVGGQLDREPAPVPPRENLLVALLLRIGKQFVERCRDGTGLLNFLGYTLIVLGRLLLRPWRIRWRAVFVQMEVAGINALPIVGLICFLIGIVLAFQGAVQLEKFGAQIFTINIVGLGVLREMAIILTAIIVAGRSGSAFAAQLGTMKVSEEIDALRTIGLDPMEVLVIPRVLGLVLVMPFLTFYADIMGLAGGALQATTQLDMTLIEFVSYLQTVVTLNDFFVGLVKAPLFAFIIALVGCYEGLKVSRSAESVGTHTTKSVVEAIFIVIVLDALLSIFFSIIGV